MLDYPAGGSRDARASNGPRAGCDRVALVDQEIPSGAISNNIAATALATLFSIDDLAADGGQNFIARTRDTLTLDHVDMDTVTARVDLRGELLGLTGACDNMRARAQIRRTVLDAPGVTQAVLYRNGTRSRLQPGGRGGAGASL